MLRFRHKNDLVRVRQKTTWPGSGTKTTLLGLRKGLWFWLK